MLRGNSIPGGFVFRSRGNRGTCLVLPFLNRQRSKCSTVQATFVIFTNPINLINLIPINPINLINLILSASLDKFHLWAKSTTPMTRKGRETVTMTPCCSGSQDPVQAIKKNPRFFSRTRRPEKPGEIRSHPIVFQNKNLRSLKKQKKHVQIIVLHLMLSEISDKKAVFGCCSRFGKIDMMKRQKSPLGSGMERWNQLPIAARGMAQWPEILNAQSALLAWGRFKIC